MSDDSRIHLLGNGATPRQKKKVGSQNATLDELHQALMAERVENEKMVTWYLKQLPELVAKMVSDAMKANGMEMLPPQPVWDQYRGLDTSNPDGLNNPSASSTARESAPSGKGIEMPDVDAQSSGGPVDG